MHVNIRITRDGATAEQMAELIKDIDLYACSTKILPPQWWL